MSDAGATAAGPTPAAGDRRRSWGELGRRAARRGLRLLRALRRLLGIRRGIHVEGVYYKELTPESLTRALSRRGCGHKDYRVTFPPPDRSKQVIRCTRDDVFADLMGPVGLDRLEVLLPLVKPGGRILEVDAGTGYRAHWLSFVVGPSGGVVAISMDKGHVAYAQRRYSRPNIAFELGEGFALAGETDGSFDAVVALRLPPDPAQRNILINELWRLTRPGGAMLLGPIDDASARARIAEIAAETGDNVRDLPSRDTLIVRRPADA